MDHLRPAEPTQPSVVALALDDLAVTADPARVHPRPCFARLCFAVLLLAGWHALRRAFVLWAAPNALDVQLGVLGLALAAGLGAGGRVLRLGVVGHAFGVGLGAGSRGVRLRVPGAGLGAGLGRAPVRGEEAGLGVGLGAGSRGVRLRVRRGSWRHDGHVGEEGVKQTDAMAPFVAIEWKAAGSQLRQHIHVRHPLENLSWSEFAHVFQRTSDVGVSSCRREPHNENYVSTFKHGNGALA